MPAYARYDMYDDDNRLIARENTEELEDMHGYANVGGAAKAADADHRALAPHPAPEKPPPQALKEEKAPRPPAPSPLPKAKPAPTER